MEPSQDLAVTGRPSYLSWTGCMYSFRNLWSSAAIGWSPFQRAWRSSSVGSGSGISILRKKQRSDGWHFKMSGDWQMFVWKKWRLTALKTYSNQTRHPGETFQSLHSFLSVGSVFRLRQSVQIYSGPAAKCWNIIRFWRNTTLSQAVVANHISQ